jgi:hypothetical protein
VFRALPKEKLSRFRFKKVTLGFLIFKYVVMLLNYSFMLLVVVISLVML